MDPQLPDRSRGAPRASGALAGLEALEHQRQPQAMRPVRATPIGRVDAPVTAVGVPTSRVRRNQIRRTAPFVALLLPAVLGVTSFMLLRNSTSVTRGVGGFGIALLAAPLLPAFGAPLRTGSGSVMAAAAASAAMWFVLGAFAAQRATRSLAAGWGRFWGEYLWLATCVWLGAILAVVAANLVLGRVLL